jgi:hypothetical protein
MIPVIQERGSRGSVCANDALVMVDGEQHSPVAVFGHCKRDDPRGSKLLPKKSLFDGARRRDCQDTRQCVGPFRQSGIDRRDVQYRHQASIRAENRRSRAAEVYVPRSIVLAPMDRDRPFFADDGTNAVGAFESLVPDAAKPGAPVAKPACIRLVTAMLHRNTGIVAEKQRVPRFPNQLVKAVEFILRGENQLIERPATLADLG